MKIRSILLTSACAVAPFGSAAFAQAANDDVSSGAGREIIVTAQKRAEALENVPIAITALSEQRLAATNVTNFTDVTALSPGTTISNTGPFFLPAIRGVTSQGISGGNENNIATYIDGIYQPNQIGLNFDLASVESIEILKGPQGTLFGRNATGGAILVKTLDPGKDFEGRVKVSYARFNDFRAKAYLSVPLNDSLAFNIAALYRNSDGFMKDISGFDSASHKEVNVRTKLKYTSGSGFSAILGFTYINLNANNSVWQYVDNPGAALIAALPPPNGLGGVNANMTTKPYTTSYSFPPQTKSEVFAPNLTTEFDIGGVHVKTISSYQDITEFTRIDIDGSPLPIARQDTDHKNTVHSEEINFSSKIGDRVDWVAGLFYFTNKWVTGPNSINFAAPTFNTLKAKSWAAFADTTVRLTDRLFLVGGLRYSWEKRSQSATYTATTAPVYTSGTWHNFTPRAVLRYEVADRTNVYASWSRGFKSGNVDLSGAIIKPEKIDAYELGFKTVTGKLRFDASTYYYNYRNLQDNQTIQSGGGLLTMQGNVASARIYGAEAQADYTPIDNLDLFAGISWLHARYRSYPAASSIVKVAIPNTPFFSWTTIPEDLSGKEMPRAPQWTLNGGFNYRIDAGGTGSFDVAGSVSYMSAHNPNRSTLDPATGDYLYRVPGYALVNASLTWHSTDKKYEVSVFGTNIFDKQYYAVYDAFSTFGKYVHYGEPATYGVSFGVNF